MSAPDAQPSMVHAPRGRWQRLRRRWVITCACGWRTHAGPGTDPHAVSFQHMLNPEEWP